MMLRRLVSFLRFLPHSTYSHTHYSRKTMQTLPPKRSCRYLPNFVA